MSGHWWQKEMMADNDDLVTKVTRIESCLGVGVGGLGDSLSSDAAGHDSRGLARGSRSWQTESQAKAQIWHDKPGLKE
jgi:hypothetical protein